MEGSIEPFWRGRRFQGTALNMPKGKDDHSMGSDKSQLRGFKPDTFRANWAKTPPLGGKDWAELKGDAPKVTEPNLRFPAVFCENLRFPAKICGFLRFPAPSECWNLQEKG